MKRAHFRFYAELNDFLPPARRSVAFPHDFQGRPSVKDVIEALGVPHTEVDLILADGESVDFSWNLRDAVRVSVYPVFESIDITPVTRVRPAPLRESRFVLDGHLGRLARYLRMLGFDARWRGEAEDEDVARELPPGVRERHDAFRRCPSCGRVYWAGSHHQRMERLIAALLAPPASSSPG